MDLLKKLFRLGSSSEESEMKKSMSGLILESAKVKQLAPHSAIYTRGGDHGQRIALIDLVDEGGNQTNSETASTMDEPQGEQPIISTSQEQNIKKYGTFNGVFVRVCVSIFGVMMFLRMGWMVGHAGLGYSLLIVAMSVYVTVATTFSLSALCTNGRVLAGGPYYLVSRSAGIEYGQLVGLVFSFAQSIAVALNTVGFAEEVVKLYDDHFTGTRDWDVVVVALCANVGIFITAIFGVGWVNKTNLILFVCVILGVISFFIGALYRENDHFDGYTGWDTDSFVENFYPHFDNGVTFFQVVGVFFPAVTGIMQGANMSGELRNPSVNVPVGTLSAIGFTTIVYLLILFTMAFTGSYTMLQKEIAVSIMPQISFWGPLVYAGAFAATLSTALGLLLGGPRVFIATLNDNLLHPKLGFFLTVDKKGDPIRCYVLVVIIASITIVVFQGKLNAIAPLVTNLYMLVYAIINLAVFLSSYSKSPGWRPAFKYYNKWHSLSGAAACIAFMVIVNQYMAISIGFLSVALYVYVYYNKPNINMGGALQARAYVSAVSSIYELESAQHVKNFRPQYLTISNLTTDIDDLIKAVSIFYKGRGIMVQGSVLVGILNKQSISIAKEMSHARKINKMFVFPEVLISKSYRHGIKSLLQSGGVGKLRPNVTVLEWWSNWTKREESDLETYVETIKDAMRLDMGVMIVRKIDELLHQQKFNGNIDVYWLTDDGGLLLLLAYLLSRNWSSAKLRVFTLEGTLGELRKILDIFRIEAIPGELRRSGPSTVSSPNGTESAYSSNQGSTQSVQESVDSRRSSIDIAPIFEEIEETNKSFSYYDYVQSIQEVSRDAMIAFITLPVPRVNQSLQSYLQLLDALSSTQCPCFLAHGNNKNVFTPFL